MARKSCNRGGNSMGDGEGVQWNRGIPSFESDRVARRARNHASLHEDAANMRELHKANYERQERRSGHKVDVHEKAQEHREHHKAKYDADERKWTGGPSRRHSPGM